MITREDLSHSLSNIEERMGDRVIGIKHLYINTSYS
jgi:hypothetical protein